MSALRRTPPRLERRKYPRRDERKVARAIRALVALAAVSGVMGIATAAERDELARHHRAPAKPIVFEPGLESLLPPPPPKREPPALTPALRARGYNACMMPDPGFGPYSRWINVSTGQMIVPERGGHTSDFGYDVVVHFHGHEAVRHSFAQVARGAVLVGIDMGIGSGPYEDAFDGPDRWLELVKSVTRGLVRHSGDPRAHIRHLALSSWSAGYGAVTKILRRFSSSIDAVVLLDSLHSSYTSVPPGDPHAIHGVWGLPIEPVVKFAERAMRGDGILFLSHSQVVPPGYASTTEVADFLLGDVAGVRVPMQGVSPLGAELLSGYDHAGLHVRGYRGGNEAAHCAHTELLAEAVREYLEPAWGTPAAERR